MSKEIPLSQGKIAIVDAEDYEKLSAYTWCFNKRNKSGNGYAQRTQHIKLGFKKI